MSDEVPPVPLVRLQQPHVHVRRRDAFALDCLDDEFIAGHTQRRQLLPKPRLVGPRTPAAPPASCPR